MYRYNCFVGALMLSIMGLAIGYGVVTDVYPHTMEYQEGIDFYFLGLFSCAGIGCFWGAINLVFSGIKR